MGHVKRPRVEFHLPVRAGFASSLFFDQRIASRQLGNVAHLTNLIILPVEPAGTEKSPKFRRLFGPFWNSKSSLF